jgi:hypothetical protein
MSHDPIHDIGKILSEAAPRQPRRRHHDDDYVDHIEIAAEGIYLCAHIVPRYKTSGLSGDEWRVRAQMDLFEEGARKPSFTRSFGCMKSLLNYGPYHVYANARRSLDRKPASLVARRKGITLMRHQFPTFGDAAIGMSWHITCANEGSPDVAWHHLTEAEERAHCQQVGCSDPPKNFYRLKQLQIEGSDVRPPKYDFEGQYTWYCPRHTERGDAGLEDCDDNMELVAGSGVPVVRPEDESPAVLGGVIHLVPTEGE